MSDKDRLDDLKERWTAATNYWRETREEGRRDVRALSPAGTWDDTERNARAAAGRPCLSLDELTQHVNQLINEVRANKRAIKVSPAGNGASDAYARYRAMRIREIEYRSHAQMAYTTMFENAVQRGFGFLRINTRYVNDQSFDLEPVIEPIWNPDLVTIEPASTRSDCSDMRFAFVHEKMPVAEFKRQFPDARVKSFDSDHQTDAQDWLELGEKRLRLAEYWDLDTTKVKIQAIRNAETGEITIIRAGDPLPAAWSVTEVAREREVEDKRVRMSLTNGVEILETTDWPGRYIPIVGCFGKILYVDDGSGSKRMLMSLIRLARDPQQLYNYYRTTEAELVGMTPKSPYMAYEGSLSPENMLLIQKSLHEPVAVIQVKPTSEMTGQNVLPMPNRQPYDPPIQAMEIGAESARRAIQSAVGSMPLPTNAQRMNEKSGVALKQIEQTAQRGSYHFIDHYEDALRMTGVILDDLLNAIEDTPREVGIRDNQDESSVIRINDPEAVDDEFGEPLMVGDYKGQHDVTISTGPSYDSERAQASEFADQLAALPGVFPLIGPLIVKLKNLGPIGDEIADALKVLQPPELRAEEGEKPDPMQMMAQLQQASQMIESLQAQMGEMAQIIETKQVEERAETERTMLEAQSKQQVEAVKAELALALQEMKGQQAQILELMKQQHAHVDREDTQAHELGMKAADLAIPQPPVMPYEGEDGA